MIRGARTPLALVLVALTGACAALTEPDFPVDAVRIEPPARYAAWWKVTEACSGMTGDFSSVDWYVAPSDRLTVAGYEFDGYTWRDGGHRIVLAQPMVTEGELVRHEMLHVLLQQGGHPAAFFRERCGGIVVCISYCAEEAGAYRQPTHGDSIIDATALTRGANVTPSSVSLTRDSGWMSIVVAARNDRPYPVWVRLKRNPESGAWPQFWVDSPSSGRRSSYYKEEFIPFGPGETRRIVIDDRVNMPAWNDLPVGHYTFTAGFSTAGTRPVPFEVIP